MFGSPFFAEELCGEADAAEPMAFYDSLEQPPFLNFSSGDSSLPLDWSENGMAGELTPLLLGATDSSGAVTNAHKRKLTDDDD